jgi:hypothetical protein
MLNSESQYLPRCSQAYFAFRRRGLKNKALARGDRFGYAPEEIVKMKARTRTNTVPGFFYRHIGECGPLEE